MTNTQHTPGPWTLETVETSSGICHKVGPFPWKHGKQNHACIYVDYPSIMGSYIGPVEAELHANARLIAAAPDLLEKLQKLVAEATEMAELLAMMGRLPARIGAENMVIADARAAIAKVTREEG